jgi:hypothetical protein
MTEAKLAPNPPDWMVEGLVTLMTERRKALQRIASSTGGDGHPPRVECTLPQDPMRRRCSQMAADVECVVDGCVLERKRCADPGDRKPRPRRAEPQLGARGQSGRARHRCAGRRPEAVEPLAGILILVKDNIATADDLHTTPVPLPSTLREPGRMLPSFASCYAPPAR